MDQDHYIQMLRMGMDQNALVMDLPIDAEDRAASIARAVSHLECMLESADLVANSTNEERSHWRMAAERGKL